MNYYEYKQIQQELTSSMENADNYLSGKELEIYEKAISTAKSIVLKYKQPDSTVHVARSCLDGKLYYQKPSKQPEYCPYCGQPMEGDVKWNSAT